MKSIFNYKGQTYQLDPKFYDEGMLNTSIGFQYKQYMYLIEVQDWVTLQNRITNQLKWGGLILIKNK